MNTQIVYEIVNNGYGFVKNSTFRIHGTLGGYALVHMLDGEPEDWGIIEDMDISMTMQKARIKKARFFSGSKKDPLKEWIKFLQENVISD